MSEVPHGLKGYRKPYLCTCDVCRAAWAAYCQEKRAERRARREANGGVDELARKRATKRPARRASESSDSDRRRKPAKVGVMEQAVIDECEALTKPPNPTQLVAAKSLASLIDRLNNEEGGASVVNSATKQLMALMSEIRGDTDKSKTTGKRKSGGRLATVGAMTKVKRQGA